MSIPSQESPTSYRFGNTHLLPLQRRILVEGQPVEVGARAFEVLLALIERRDRLVSRDELLDLVWPDVDVEPNNLAVQVSGLRKALGQHVIATIPGRGYRFSETVNEEAPVATRPVPDASAVHERTNLPQLLAPLIGREDALRVLGAGLDAHRVVSIVGPGGIGKSRLAQRILHERQGHYRHGVCWVELASAADAASLPSVVAAALGIGLTGGAPAEALQAALAPLEILICLDNAEHLVAETARLVESLIVASTRVRVLVTSQMPLHLPDESVMRLDALAVPPRGARAAEAIAYGAVELFVRRAQAADMRFVLDDNNAEAVIRICERLEGLPLAIEFAAVRAPLLGVDRIDASLDQRLQILTRGYASGPARQQTLRATIEWSHQLLEPDERVVFRRLAVVAGSASLELVQALVADEDASARGTAAPMDRWAAVDALAGLVDKSLAVTLTDDHDRDRPRYRLLETPRAYASELLAAAGETALIEERHARAMAAILAQAWTERWSGRIGFNDWKDQVAADGENARLAFAWAQRHQAFDLMLMMTPVLLIPALQMSTSDSRVVIAESVEQWLATQALAPSQLQARMQLTHFWNLRDLPRALASSRGALSLAEACHDRFAAYFIQAYLVRIHVQMGDMDAAAAALERTDALEDPTWPAIRLVSAANARSTYYFVKGPPQATLDSLRHEQRLSRLRGDFGYMAESNMVAVELAARDFASAVVSASTLLDKMADTRDQFTLTLVRNNLLGALLGLGRIEQAEPAARAAWQTARFYNLHGDCADYLALLCALRGRWLAAATLVGYADAVHASRGATRWPSEIHAHERTVQMLADAPDRAALERAREDGSRVLDSEVAQIAFDDQ